MKNPSSAPSLAKKLLFAMASRMVPLMFIFATFNFFILYKLGKSIEENPNQNSVESLALNSSIIIIIGAILGLAFEFLFIKDVLNKKLTQPLNELINATRRARRGDLSTKIKYDHQDEVGELAKSFNEMTAVLDKQIVNLRQTKATAEAVSTKSLQESKSKSQFLANMSHEIRTPLNGVIGVARMLENTPLEVEQRDYLNIIKTSSESLLSLINDILDLSKIESGKMELEQIAFDFEEQINHSMATLKFPAESKNLSLVLDSNIKLDNALIGDPLRIRQILFNLIGNAIKFTTNGTITLRIRLVDRNANGGLKLYLEVEDQGIGIPEDKISQLFENFSQVDSSTSRKFGGTGLGLAICKKLVEMMHGRIGVHSQIGIGSTFWLYIDLKEGQPLNQLHKSTQSPTSFNLEERDIKRSKVLIAEDNVVNQIVAKNLIERLGFEVCVVENGVQAIDAIQKDPKINLVFMDCQMPEMDGYEASKAIRLNSDPRIKSIHIIALTANAMKEDRDLCINAGMNDFISKPIEPGILEQKIQEFFNQRQ